MKKFLATCLILHCSVAASAMNIEGICQMRIEKNTNRAQWGLDMRKDVKTRCKSCTQQYLDAIDKQAVKDNEATLEAFRVAQPDQTVRMLLLAQDTSDKIAALRGFRGEGATAKVIAYQMYNECVATGAAAQAKNQAPTAAPDATSSCTNYSILGQNGNTQYCQKCCWGANNCNVTCY